MINVDSKNLIIIFFLAFIHMTTNVAAMETQPKDEHLLSGLVYDVGQKECCVCSHDFSESPYIALFPCGHFFCVFCEDQFNKACPLCRSEKKIFFLYYEDLAADIPAKLLLWQLSDGTEEKFLKLLMRLDQSTNEKKGFRSDFLTFLNNVDEHGQTVLERAIMKKWKKAALFLEQVCSNTDVKISNNVSAYEVATKKNLKILKKLLKLAESKKSDWTNAPSSWKFCAKKKVWDCLFYNVSKSPLRRDAKSKIYVGGGVLVKYDLLFNSKALAYETLQEDIDSKNVCLGHSAEAAAVACILEPPIRSVIKGNKGKNVFFSVEEIAYLLIKIIPHLVTIDSVENLLEQKEGCSELRPEIFLEAIRNWDKDHHPVVLDFSSDGKKMLSLPCDEIEIAEFSEQVDTALIKYYRAIASGGGYRRIFGFSLEYDQSSKLIKSAWIKNKYANDPPRAMWRPRMGDSIKRSWQRNNTWNPHIDPEIVFEIYKKSVRKYQL